MNETGAIRPMTATEIEESRKDLELARRVADAIRWDQAPDWATHYRLLPTAGLWLSSKHKAEQILLAPLFGAMTATEAMCVPMHLSTFDRPVVETWEQAAIDGAAEAARGFNPRDERETSRPVFGRGEPGHVVDVHTTEGRAALNQETVQRYDRAIDRAVDVIVEHQRKLDEEALSASEKEFLERVRNAAAGEIVKLPPGITFERACEIQSIATTEMKRQYEPGLPAPESLLKAERMDAVGEVCDDWLTSREAFEGQPVAAPQRGDIAYAEQLGGKGDVGLDAVVDPQTFGGITIDQIKDVAVETPLQTAEREFRQAYFAREAATKRAVAAQSASIAADEDECLAMRNLAQARKKLIAEVIGPTGDSDNG